MKKCLSLLLAVLLLCGGLCIGASAAAAPKVKAAAALPVALRFLDLKNLTDQQIDFFVKILDTAKANGLDYSEYLQKISPTMSITLKSALHRASVTKFPIYERSLFWNFIFKWILFGWIWMK